MTEDVKGRSLELFFIDGKPDGMLTAEIFNWTGHVLMAPRTQISEALKRKEASYTGVYLLFGEQNGEPLAYIGEGEDIAERIRTHDTKKDWWTSAILVTSSANVLNKAHVKYLEARLVEEARSVGKVKLENGNTPSRPGLSEASRANMEAFLEQIMLVLPALRIDSFLKQTRPKAKPAEIIEMLAVAPTFELVSVRNGLHATARLEDGEFIVQAGSTARKEWIGEGYANSTYARLYGDLVKSGILLEQGAVRVFSENYAFSSTSAAGSVVTGRSTAGTEAWKVRGLDVTYKQWEAEKLAGEQL